MGLLAQAMEHTISPNINPASKTHNFIKSLELLKLPRDIAEYSLDVQVDALSYDQMDDWRTTGESDQVLEDVIEMFKKANKPEFPGTFVDKSKVPKPGTELKNFGNMNWTVMASDEDKIMITSDLVPKNILEGLVPIKEYSETIPLITFYEEFGVYGLGYEDSQFKIANDKYYNKYILDHDEDYYVLPIVIPFEEPRPDDVTTSNQGATYVSEDGKKQPFLLGFGDYVAHKLKYEHFNLKSQ